MTSSYQQSRFAFSVNDLAQLPTESSVEVAFAGRSNAGKSSALNTLTRQKNLARVSKTPGRTQLINFFTLPAEATYLVDLPGYGYADVPARIRTHWEALLSAYLMQRAALKGCVIVMDIRHPLKPLDWQMLDCCAARGLPVHILLTKADKLKRGQQVKQHDAVVAALENFPSPVTLQCFSSLKRSGVEQLVHQLDQWTGLGTREMPC